MRKVKGYKIFLFLLPGLVLYLYFFIFPTLTAYYVSLTEWNGFSAEKTFVGLKNFRNLMTDRTFGIALTNTLIITFLGGLLVFSLTLTFTYLLTKHNFKGRKFFSNIFYFPNMVSTAALAVLWAFVFSPNFGMLNNIIKLLGFKDAAIPWLSTRWSSLACIIVAQSISSVGFYLILMLSGVDKIPSTYKEAAYIDGASDLKVFFKITLPLVRDVLVIAISLWMINSLKAFEFVWALTKGGPSNLTNTMGTYIYMTAIGAELPIFKLGYSTAMAVILFITAVILVGGFRKIFDREGLQY